MNLARAAYHEQSLGHGLDDYYSEWGERPGLADGAPPTAQQPPRRDDPGRNSEGVDDLIVGDVIDGPSRR